MFAPSASVAPTPTPNDAGARATPADPANSPESGSTVAGGAERLSLGFANPAERARVLAWLDLGLRRGVRARVEREYPLLFARDSAALPITLFVGSEPAAFCILWPTRFALAGGSLGAGLISLVYTDPTHRRRGFAGQVVDRAVALARERGLGLCLLWSDLDAFYEARGFSRAGRETLLSIDLGIVDRALAASTSGPEHRVSAARERDWPAILELRGRRDCAIRFGLEALPLARIPELDVRVARRDGSVVGFAMRGRGDDFDGVVHEWGGEPEAVLLCCRALLTSSPPSPGLLLLAPRGGDALPFRLRQAGARVVTNSLAWFRVASCEALARELAALLPEADALTLRPSERPATSEPYFTWRDGRTARSVDLPASVLFAALFGSATDAAERLARTLAAEALSPATCAGLPLPFFVSGLESI